MHTSCQLITIIPLKESLVVLTVAHFGVCFSKETYLVVLRNGG